MENCICQFLRIKPRFYMRSLSPFELACCQLALQYHELFGFLGPHTVCGKGRWSGARSCTPRVRSFAPRSVLPARAPPGWWDRGGSITALNQDEIAGVLPADPGVQGRGRLSLQHRPDHCWSLSLSLTHTHTHTHTHSRARLNLSSTSYPRRASTRQHFHPGASIFLFQNCTKITTQILRDVTCV